MSCCWGEVEAPGEVIKLELLTNWKTQLQIDNINTAGTSDSKFESGASSTTAAVIEKNELFLAANVTCQPMFMLQLKLFLRDDISHNKI